MKKIAIIEIIVLLNVILFLYTGIAKIQDYTLFKEQLAGSPVMAPVAKAIAVLLPVAEFLVVLMLAVPRWRLKGLYTTLGLMIIFTAYIIVLIATSDNLPCSCGGIIEQLSWKQHIVFNGAFILLDILAIRLLWKQKKDIAQGWNEINDLHISHS